MSDKLQFVVCRPVDLVRRGHATKPLHKSIFDLHNAKALAPNVPLQYQRGQGFCVPVSLERSAQIDVGDDLAIDDDESIALQESSRVVQSAAGSQNRRLVNVLQRYSEPAAVT